MPNRGLGAQAVKQLVPNGIITAVCNCNAEVMKPLYRDWLGAITLLVEVTEQASIAG